MKSIKSLYPNKVVVEVMLADKLKEVSCQLLGIERRHIEEQSLKEQPLKKKHVLTKECLFYICDKFGIKCKHEDISKHIGVEIGTPRYAAQYIGSEILRDFSIDIHCQTAEATAKGKKAIYL